MRGEQPAARTAERGPARACPFLLRLLRLFRPARPARPARLARLPARPLQSGRPAPAERKVSTRWARFPPRLAARARRKEAARRLEVRAPDADYR